MKLKNRKSLAGNSISNKILKYEGNTMIVEIKKLIKQIFLTTQLPEEWKTIIVLPMCKESDKITIRQVFSKYSTFPCPFSCHHLFHIN
jgi:hypothetical protein